tara:strand:- start:148 stop:627 length:480 start_codon:yes stop_codon:yes gene_type:complete
MIQSPVQTAVKPAVMLPRPPVVQYLLDPQGSPDLDIGLFALERGAKSAVPNITGGGNAIRLTASAGTGTTHYLLITGGGTIGKTYYAEGWVRSDGTQQPLSRLGSSPVSVGDTSGEWQWFQTTITSTLAAMRLVGFNDIASAVGDEYVEICFTQLYRID